MSDCVRCDGTVLIDNNLDTPVWQHEVYCIACGDRWWVPVWSDNVSDWQSKNGLDLFSEFEKKRINSDKLLASIGSDKDWGFLDFLIERREDGETNNPSWKFRLPN